MHTTPEEKANYLVHKFYYQLPNNGSLTIGDFSCTRRWEEAKTCARIICEEMMKECEEPSYWAFVHTAIEKMK